MVLSATKRVSSSSSIANQNSGGGNAKGGIPKQVGKDAYTAIHISGGASASGGVRFANYGLKRVETTANPNVKQSRPIGISPMVWN
jgi:hypothetical protein